MTHTNDDTPLLTPFPRPNHLRRLREERERRRKRIGLGAALAAGVLAVGAGTAATVAHGHGGSPAVTADFALAESEQTFDAGKTLESANALLERAADKVDTSQLEGYVTYLEDVEGVPAAVASGVAAQAADEIEDVTVAVTEYEDEQARKAAERAEAEAAAAAEAEALAQVNTVDGAKAYAAQAASADYGWGADQFSCLDLLWTKESGWNHQAANPSSGAYGIPQSLPGSKMATVASDWATNAATQITWGLNYIAQVYGTPCGAWSHSQATNWY